MLFLFIENLVKHVKVKFRTGVVVGTIFVDSLLYMLLPGKRFQLYAVSELRVVTA